MMMRVAKKIGLATAAIRSTAVSRLSISVGRSSRRRIIVSIITIDPSTRIPKSMAPSESRLAGTSVKCIRINATSNDIGMAIATRNAARGLPKKQISTAMTSNIPNSNVCETVCKVVFTKWVLSITGLICTPCGNAPCVLSSSTAACTCSKTADGFW